ncbi:unnamed protein product [Musa acuminata subsp. burmannicoides]
MVIICALITLFHRDRKHGFFLAHAHAAVSRYVSGKPHDISYTRSQNRVPCLGRDKRADSMTYYLGHIMSSHVGVVFWLNVKYFLPPSRDREREVGMVCSVT